MDGWREGRLERGKKGVREGGRMEGWRDAWMDGHTHKQMQTHRHKLTYI